MFTALRFLGIFEVVQGHGALCPCDPRGMKHPSDIMMLFIAEFIRTAEFSPAVS